MPKRTKGPRDAACRNATNSGDESGDRDSSNAGAAHSALPCHRRKAWTPKPDSRHGGLRRARPVLLDRIEARVQVAEQRQPKPHHPQGQEITEYEQPTSMLIGSLPTSPGISRQGSTRSLGSTGARQGFRPALSSAPSSSGIPTLSRRGRSAPLTSWRRASRKTRRKAPHRDGPCRRRRGR